MVAVPALPKLNVPDVRFNVPTEVSWNPPSLKILLEFIVRVVVVAAAPSVAPLALVLLI